MKQKIKRWTSVFLALVMVLGMLPFMSAPALAAPGDVAINATNFPDDNFREVINQYDPNKDGVLTQEEISTITAISLRRCAISSLEGIEHFTALQALWVYENNLTSLDVTGLPWLEKLDVRNNQLTSLNVAGMSRLKDLQCSNNQLTAVDLTGLTALESLDLDNNELTGELDLRHLSNLQTLWLRNNQLTNVNVRNLSKLRYAFLEGNQITSLDVRGTPALQELLCSNNNMLSLNLEMSNFPNLKRLDCSGNRLTSLSLTKLTKLEYLDCGDNYIKNLNVSGLPELKALICRNNRNMNALDVSANTKLETLICGGNVISSLNLRSNTSLKYLNVNNTLQINFLNLAHMPQLERLDINFTSIGSLDLSKLPNLEILSCYGSNISTLDLRPAPKLDEALVSGWKSSGNDNGHTFIRYAAYNNYYDLYVDSSITLLSSGVRIDANNFHNATFRNFVKEYDVDNNDWLSLEERNAVTSMTCRDLEISNLKGVEFFTELTHLDCNGNSLTSLDVSALKKLAVLRCEDNNLTSLNLSQNTNLEIVRCSRNSLTSLNVSGLTKLVQLHCAENNLGSLNLSGLNNLTLLDCGDNQITTLNLANLPKLQTVDCAFARPYPSGFVLSGLNLPELVSLRCNGCALQTLDLSQCSKLETFYGDKTSIRNLTLHAAAPLRQFAAPALQSASSLDLTAYTGLVSLDCSSWATLTSLDISVFPALQNAVKYGTYSEGTGSSGGYRLWDNFQNGYLKLHANTALIKCRIDEDTFPDYHFRIYVQNNYDSNHDGFLSDIETDGVTAMNCRSNAIASLKGIEYFTGLTKLWCESNNLTALDLSGLSELTDLRCYENQITQLDLRSTPALLSAYKAGNPTYGDNYLHYHSDQGDLYVDSTVTLVGAVSLNAANFPDANFRSYVAGFDTAMNLRP